MHILKPKGPGIDIEAPFGTRPRVLDGVWRSKPKKEIKLKKI